MVGGLKYEFEIRQRRERKTVKHHRTSPDVDNMSSDPDVVENKVSVEMSAEHGTELDVGMA